MSVSLQESKNAEIIQESNNLLEAGLEKEAIEKRKTLENFGFISNHSVRSKPKSFSKSDYLLFKQTENDRRDKIIDKVAMILLDADIDASWILSANPSSNTRLVSKYLNTIRNVDNKLWKKSLLEEENVCEYYVNQLSKFMKPCKSNSIIGLKNDFIHPTRHITLIHESNMIDKEFADKSHIAVDNSNVDNESTTSHNIVVNKTMLEYSSKWKSMIGNQFMSDLTIFAKDEHEIPAHSLVFHVQCPDILNDVVTEESDTCKSKKMLMWLEYSSESCLAFLELIYSGQEPIIKPEFRESYLHLGTRYNILMALSDSKKPGGFSTNTNKESKRKSSELYNLPYDCKRYKSSSPDMFMSDDRSEGTCTSANFLFTTEKDEKYLGTLRTKQWLECCLYYSRRNAKPKKSSFHSFHSTSTINLSLTDYDFVPENNDVQTEFSSDIDCPLRSPLSIMEEDVETPCVSPLPTTEIVNSNLTPTKITKSIKEPEFITINSDSETESINMILFNNIKIPGHKNLNFNSPSENNTFLSQSSLQNFTLCNSSNDKRQNSINIIELNDNSLDSIHSACTNMFYERNFNTKSSHSLFYDSVSNTKDNIGDSNSVLSAVTNVLPLNNERTQTYSSNNGDIDLIECSSSDSISIIDMTSVKHNNSMISVSTYLDQHNNGQNYSTSFSNITSSKENLSVSETDLTTKFDTNNLAVNSLPFKTNLNNYSYSKSNEDCFISSNKKTSDYFGLNSSNPLSYSNLPKDKDDSHLLSKSKQLFHLDNVSSEFLKTTSHIKLNDLEENVKSIEGKSCNTQNVLDKSNLDSKLLENIVTTSSILPSNNYNDPCVNNKEIITNNYNDPCVNNKEIINLTSLPSSECKNKHLINTAILQAEPNQLSEIITSEVTIPNENNHELNKSNIEQIIDDPWMDYNDLQAFNFSPQYISPVLSESTSMVDESKEQKTRKKNLDLIYLDSPTPSTTSNYSNCLNSKKKNSLTPNKYNTIISTPKSLRRVQSESVIGSKQHVTPLPDYSSMKTPDLRKEFDRYGLKDLGRRKGKLILRHIYDTLHPLASSEEDNCNIEYEQYSSSSDIYSSEHGIPDYEDGNYDEFETLNPTNLSNKISVESGFKQLLETNEDLHYKILCYEPIWIEKLKEDLKQHNVNISMQKLMTFLDDKCVTFRSKSLTDQRQKTLAKKNSKRKKLF